MVVWVIRLAWALREKRNFGLAGRTPKLHHQVFLLPECFNDKHIEQKLAEITMKEAVAALY